MQETKIPSNIRQIGSIGPGLKIYLEDFVFTYLKQYAAAGDVCEKIAFLIGKQLIVDGEKTLFICGAVQGRNLISEDGEEYFSDASFRYADDQIEKYFRGFEIVGWIQSRQGFGARLSPACSQYHTDNFQKPYQVLLVMDPAEKTNCFYGWNEDHDALEEKSGYFIYFDKNDGMQEYMLQNRLTKFKTAAKTDADDDGDDDIKLARVDRRPVKTFTTYTQRNQSVASAAAARKYKTGGDGGRRLTNMLVTLSAVLFVICFIMGAGLIQNETRISALESNVNDLTNAYAYVQNQMKSTTVFAAGETQMPSPAPTPTPTASPSSGPTVTASLPPVVIQTPNSSDSAAITIAPATNPPDIETPAAVDTEAPTEEADAGAEEVGDDSGVPMTYVVQSGDSLYAISQKFYGNIGMVDAIMRVNNMENADRINIGEVLKLPRPENNN